VLPEFTVRKIVIPLVIVALSGLGLSAGSQQPLPTFSASVDLVPISASVHDRRGRPVTTLRANDFEVFDKGERRRIIDFQEDHRSPLTLALLVDVSGSMRIGPKLSFARQVVERIVAQLEDGHDEAGLFTFDATLHEEHPFTKQPSTIDSTLTNAHPFGTTSLYDAIAATARRLAQRAPAHGAVIVFTDGVDTSSVLTPSEVSALASSIDVPVYVVVTVPPIDRQRFGERELSGESSDLHDLAIWTGGDLLWVTAQDELGLRAHQIVAELRHQYVMAIESASDAAWRPLDVRVRDARLNVRARTGYFSRPTRTEP
jgi:VWFA-related protein